jgi:threonyl-tRNA synthetase
MIIPVTDKHNDYALSIRDYLIDNDIRAKADLSSERMNYKIRTAQEDQIPYMLIVGDKEMETGSVNVRYRRSQDQVSMTQDEFLAKLKLEISSKLLN